MNIPQLEFAKPKGYEDYQDDSFSKYFYLASGSYNCLVDRSGRVNSRKGVKQIGDETNTKTAGVKSAYTFLTSYYVLQNPTNLELPVKTTYDDVKVYFQGKYRTLYNGLAGEKPRFTSWYDKASRKAFMLFVKNDKYIYKWGGGIAEIGSMTASSITLKYNKRSSAINNFIFNGANKTITQTDTDFVSLGFKEGDLIRIVGTTNNNGTFELAGVSTTKITISPSATINNETISNTDCLISVNGKDSFTTMGFEATGNIKVGNTTLVYTGGATETITITNGVNPTTILAVNDVIFSEVFQLTPTGGDMIPNLPLDLISCNLNQVYVANSRGRAVFVSKQSDCADFSYNSTIRRVGDGVSFWLDDNVKSITHQDEITFFGAGVSYAYKVWYEPFSDGTTAGEIARIKPLRTAYGVAPVKNGFIPVENGIIVIRNDKVISLFGDLQNISQPSSLPLSYKISRLLNKLDFTDASGLFLKNNLFILFPKNNTLLIYDFEMGFWQPPQIISASCMNVVDGKLILHSQDSDKSYTAFSGVDDDGNSISSVVMTNTFMLGRRSDKKKWDESFIEIYLNASSKIKWETLAGYKGSDDIKIFDIEYDIDEEYYSNVPEYTSIGNMPLAYTTLGDFYPDLDLDEDIGKLRRIYMIQSKGQMENSDQFQVRLTSEELGAYYSLACLGLGIVECNETKEEYVR